MIHPRDDTKEQYGPLYYLFIQGISSSYGKAKSKFVVFFMKNAHSFNLF